MNREAWLTELANRVRPVFKGFRLPPFRVTCGWPCRMALSSRRRIGECHPPESSADGHHELFISPLLAEPIQVADTLVHEMTHVAAGIKAAHGEGFLRVARHVGLTRGRPTSASMGDALKAKVQTLMADMPAYPHSAMNPVTKQVKRDPSVTTLECACGCRITMSVRMLDEHGPPRCACGEEFQLRKKK